MACRSVILLALLGLACGRQGDTAIPRPTAYPRPVLYDTVYVDADAAPPHFEVNASAVLNRMPGKVSGVWLDVLYPAYNATLHCSFTPVDSISRIEVADNRTERMAFNLGENAAEQVDVMSDGGYQSIVLTALGPSLIPVQFLSVGRSWVVSGALELHDAAAAEAMDSIRPVIDAVRTDVIHAVRNLR